MVVRNVLRRVMAILFIGLMIVNSSMLMVVSTAINEARKIIDKSKIETVAEIGLEKYVNFDMNDEQSKGVMIQANIKTGIEYQEGQEYKAIKSTGILLNMPKINGEYPEKVEVLGISTKATNGGEAKDYQQQYEKESGKLKIVALNKENEDGKIYSENVENARDEYRIIAYYGSNCYTETSDARKLTFTGKSNFTIADEESSEISKEINQSYEVNENISGLISSEIATSDIYNGYIESNSQNNTSYRTEYTEDMKVQVSYKNIADEVKISTNNFFINSKDEEKETQEIVYKSTKINKNEVMNVLGEDGKLQILSNDGNVLGELNKDSAVDENGVFEISYDNEPTELTLKMSKPGKIGDINIQSVKQIKETMKDVDNKKIKVNALVSCTNNVKEVKKIIDDVTKEEKNVENIKQVNVYQYLSDKQIDINESETKVDVSIDKTEWTNNIQNDVVFNATLITNSEKYSLHKNPTLDIKLPDEVEKVVLGDSILLYDDELKISSVEVIEQNNNKILRVIINGSQTIYNQNDLVRGTNIIIPATIILKKNILDKKSDIELMYTNNFTRQTVTEKKEINIKSFGEVVKTTNNVIKTINNIETKKENTINLNINAYAQVGSEILTENSEVKNGEIIKYVVEIENASDKDISNVSIIGEVPDRNEICYCRFGKLL